MTVAGAREAVQPHNTYWGGAMTDFYLYLAAEINATSANNLIQYLGNLIAQAPTQLTIAMNSPGGNVVQGIAIYNAMLAMPYQITTHNVGNVDSIANVVFLSGTYRYASSASTFMFHGVGFPGNPNVRLEENNLKAMLNTVLADHRRISGIFAHRTNGRVTVRSGMRLFKEQRTRSAQWAADKGFATGIQDFVLPAGANVNFLV
jgi:ATP-dependent Clp protease, protease subunit